MDFNKMPDILELLNFILENWEECGDGFMISNSLNDNHNCPDAKLYRMAKEIKDSINVAL